MKQLTLIMLLATMFMQAPPAYAGWYRDANSWVENNSPMDKSLHVGIGLGISHILKMNGANTAFSVAIPATIGFVKESTDKNFSTADLFSWIAGGIIGAVLDSTAIQLAPSQDNPGINLQLYLD